LRRALIAAGALFIAGTAAVGLLVLSVGPERVRDKVIEFVPGMSEVLVVPEGFNLYQVAERLDGLGICGRGAFVAAAHDAALLAELGIAAPSAEGYLSPATYTFGHDIAAERVLRKMVARQKARLAALRSDRERTSLSEASLLTLASLVEKESAVADERPRIARVFANRLADVAGPTRGRLQSDPTAAYGCLEYGEAIDSCHGFRGVVTPELLRDSSNPYNTYRRAGLPPGPIANPGQATLEAVLHPAPGDDLYFVADGTGRHTFSRSFDDHKQAIEKRKGREN
jgi:UPF0755 protein